jgi:pimeloyl-ACP methyl ester carboxylesterase
LSFTLATLFLLSRPWSAEAGTVTATKSHKVKMQKQTGYAAVNGLKIYYEVYGRLDEANPPLVLLHGGGSTIETSFGALLPNLVKDRTVIAYEQQGHGHTADIPDRPFTFDQSAEDAVGLLQYLKIQRADWFGYSNGGHIALRVAIAHPEVVRRLVVESAMVRKDGSPAEFWDSFKTAKLENMPAELREEYLRVAPHPQDLPAFFTKSVQRMMAFKDWPEDELRSLHVPTLLIIGDHDLVRPEHAVWLSHLLPQAQLAVLPGTDHMSIVKRSEWVPSMIQAFLNPP